MEERLRFVMACEANDLSMSELCRQFGVSRKTGYKWLARYEGGGLEALGERSCAPGCCPHALDASSREAALAVRRRHPTWGPKKIRAVLAREHPGHRPPAASTIGDLLAREGLVYRRRKRQRVSPRTAPLAHARQPNDVWCIDLKGWFLTGDGARCEPLTLADAASRYLVRCQAVVRHDAVTIWPILDAAFREFALPLSIRSDNGPPFGSTGAGRLTPLGVRIVKAGVGLDHIDPGAPEQNGRLERLHRTLKEDTANPPARSLAAQARRLKAFRKTYNEERPHEALDMDVPAAHYVASPRRWSGRLRSPDYGEGVFVRRVRRNGEIKWRGGLIYIAETLAGEPVGIEEIDNDVWRVDFGPVHLGTIDGQGKFHRPRALRSARGRTSNRAKSVTHAPG